MNALIYNTKEDFEAGKFWVRDAHVYTNPMMHSFLRCLFPDVYAIELVKDYECVAVL